MVSSDGGSRFSRIPTASSSPSNKALCSALFVASNIIRIRSLVYAHSAPIDLGSGLHDHFCGADDLPPPPLALASTFDDSWQIKHLDLGTTIFQNAGYGCQGGKGVSGNLAFSFRNF